MKIIIIGSKGFIGSHCLKFFSQYYEVWGCDVVLDYNEKKYFYIEPTESDFSFIFVNNKFDVCINCSGAANVSFSLEMPLNDFQLNTLNVFKILDAIRKFNPNCKFINLSSAAVYGNPKKLPIREDEILNPVSPYGYHKKMAEMICEEFYRFWGIKTISLRIFSAFGPGLKKQIFWDISQKLRNNSDILELFGTGNETRDFIYIDDLIRVIEIVILKADFNGSVINAANGMQIKISEIAEITKNQISPNARISFNGINRKGDPLYWEADVSNIMNLGYKSNISIKKGITKYIKWLKENGSV